MKRLHSALLNVTLLLILTHQSCCRPRKKTYVRYHYEYLNSGKKPKEHLATDIVVMGEIFINPENFDGSIKNTLPEGESV